MTVNVKRINISCKQLYNSNVNVFKPGNRWTSFLEPSHLTLKLKTQISMHCTNHKVDNQCCLFIFFLTSYNKAAIALPDIWLYPSPLQNHLLPFLPLPSSLDKYHPHRYCSMDSHCQVHRKHPHISTEWLGMNDQMKTHGLVLTMWDAWQHFSLTSHS